MVIIVNKFCMYVYLPVFYFIASLVLIALIISS